MLTDKVVIVTGAANGIGTALARRFAAEGAIVALADIDGAGLRAAAEEITTSGGRVSLHTVDISSVASCDHLAAEVSATHGRIDVLVNNAAIYRGILLEDTTPEYLDKIMQVNLWGAWRTSRAVVPTMIRQGGGKIVNQSSDAAYFYASHPMHSDALPNFNYGMSKWGLNGLTKFMAYTLGPHNINVNCICPGVVMTQATQEGMSSEVIDGMVSTIIPLRRTLQPEDVVGAAVFFAGPDADLVTGQILCVDGGMVMPA